MKEIPLSKGMIAIVDDEDYDYLSQWKWLYKTPRKHNYVGYAVRFEKLNDNKFKEIRMHREIMNCPKGLQVDHINHNGIDNRRSNIRIATARQNRQNTSLQNSNTSGYKGVNRDGNKWRATIRAEGKRINLGRFKEKIDAAIAYNKAAIKYHKEFAYINPIPLCCGF
jgi:hypothetical protein